MLADKRVDRQNGSGAQNPSLLAGLLYYCGNKERLTPSHAVKKGRRYRYYISRDASDDPGDGTRSRCRIPAGDIERIVTQRLQGFLSNPAELLGALESHAPEAFEQKGLLDAAASLEGEWADLEPSKLRVLLLTFVPRIEVHPERVDIHIAPARLTKVLRNGSTKLPPAHKTSEETHAVLSVPARLRRTRMEIKMLIEGDTEKSGPDPGLVRLIVKAHSVKESLSSCGGMELRDLAKHHGVGDSYITRLFRLTFLAPDITRAILEGRQPPELTGARLMRDTRFPLDWEEQRLVLGFA